MTVLVVDDDAICLEIMRKMLIACCYDVTPCLQAKEALSILRKNKGMFDILLADVDMPEMNGFELLKIVGLEMDLPVVMMTGDVTPRLVSDGIRHGACDFLVKPVRIEEFRNIWQHVIRKRQHVSNLRGSLESEDKRNPTDECDHDTSVNDESDSEKCHKKEVSNEDGDGEVDTGDSSLKKRVYWTRQLHQQFVSAVNEVGIDKAFPKTILKLMKVPGLSRENVASHLQLTTRDNAAIGIVFYTNYRETSLLRDGAIVLHLPNEYDECSRKNDGLPVETGVGFVGSKGQKYKLHLKKGAQQQGIMPNGLFGARPHAISGLLNRLNFPTFAVPGILHQRNTLHARLLGQPSDNFAATGMNQLVLKQASTQGLNHIPVKCGIALSRPLVNLPTNISQDSPPSSSSVESRPSCASNSPINNLSMASSASSHGVVNNSQKGSVPVWQQEAPYSLSASSHSISEKPCTAVLSQELNDFMNGSSTVLSSEPLDGFHAMSNHSLLNWNSMAFVSQTMSSIQEGNTYVPCEQNHRSNNERHILDYDLLSSQLKDEALTKTEAFNGYPFPGSVYPSFSPCKESSTWIGQTPYLDVGPDNSLSCLVSNLCNAQGSMVVNDLLPRQGLGNNLGYIGSTQYTVDGISSLEESNLMYQNENPGAELPFGYYGQL